MERMSPLAFGLGSKFNETVRSKGFHMTTSSLVFQYFAEYADAINHITLTKGAYALIDPHNYMRYK